MIAKALPGQFYVSSDKLGDLDDFSPGKSGTSPGTHYLSWLAWQARPLIYVGTANNKLALLYAYLGTQVLHRRPG